MTPVLTASDLENPRQKIGVWGQKTASGIFLEIAPNLTGAKRRNPAPPRLVARLARPETASGARYYGYRYYNASLGRFINRDMLEEQGGHNLYSGLKCFADDPYAGASGVQGTSWETEWEQAQDRLLVNTSLPHTTQTISFDGKRNSGLPGASEDNQKTYSANATGHYAQGGAEGTGPQPPSMSVGDPAAGNADVNLYIYAGNNPINSYDALGLFDSDNKRSDDDRFRLSERERKEIRKHILRVAANRPKKSSTQSKTATDNKSGTQNSGAQQTGENTQTPRGSDELRAAALAFYNSLPADVKKTIRDTYLDPNSKIYGIKDGVGSEVMFTVGQYQKKTGEIYYLVSSVDTNPYNTEDTLVGGFVASLPKINTSIIRVLEFHSHGDDRSPGFSFVDRGNYQRGFGFFMGTGKDRTSYTRPVDYSGAFYGKQQIFYGWSSKGEYNLTFEEMRNALK